MPPELYYAKGPEDVTPLADIMGQNESVIQPLINQTRKVVEDLSMIVVNMATAGPGATPEVSDKVENLSVSSEQFIRELTLINYEVTKAEESVSNASGIKFDSEIRLISLNKATELLTRAAVATGNYKTVLATNLGPGTPLRKILSTSRIGSAQLLRLTGVLQSFDKIQKQLLDKRNRVDATRITMNKAMEFQKQNPTSLFTRGAVPYMAPTESRKTGTLGAVFPLYPSGGVGDRAMALNLSKGFTIFPDKDTIVHEFFHIMQFGLADTDPQLYEKIINTIFNDQKYKNRLEKEYRATAKAGGLSEDDIQRHLPYYLRPVEIWAREGAKWIETGAISPEIAPFFQEMIDKGQITGVDVQFLKSLLPLRANLSKAISRKGSFNLEDRLAELQAEGGLESRVAGGTRKPLISDAVLQGYIEDELVARFDKFGAAEVQQLVKQIQSGQPLPATINLGTGKGAIGIKKMMARINQEVMDAGMASLGISWQDAQAKVEVPKTELKTATELIYGKKGAPQQEADTTVTKLDPADQKRRDIRAIKKSLEGKSDIELAGEKYNTEEDSLLTDDVKKNKERSTTAKKKTQAADKKRSESSKKVADADEASAKASEEAAQIQKTLEDDSAKNVKAAATKKTTGKSSRDLGGTAAEAKKKAEEDLRQAQIKIIDEYGLISRIAADKGMSESDVKAGLKFTGKGLDVKPDRPDELKVTAAIKTAEGAITQGLVYYIQTSGQYVNQIFSQADKTQMAKAEIAARKEAEQLETNKKGAESIIGQFPKGYLALMKQKPDLVNDPSTQYQYTTATSTGVTHIKATRKDDFGGVEVGTVAVDKFGNSIADTSRRFADFTTALKTNVGQFFRWSMAVSLVYVPLQKLTEILSLAIAGQEKLVHVAITLGQSQSGLSQIMENAYKVAIQTGASLNGVIDGYNQAVRATGEMGDSAERTAKAMKLLNDSIVLSKLSGMDQASSTDALVASLRQMGMDLGDGDKLLDKWVKTSRVANVDVATLATSFSIVGEAATKAGLSVDELNGLIATVSEVTTLGARETGNSVRAMISGYSSDNAMKELQKFGISVKTSEGDARGFKDVMGDIKRLFDAGMISDDQLNKIAMVIGNGNRRQAQVVSTIVTLNRMNEVATQSADAHAEAQKALSMEMTTVNTATTNLNSSFQYLATTLGMEGGILSSVSALANGFTGLLEIFAKLSSTLGTAAPVLIAFGIAMKAIKSDRLKSELEGVGSFLGKYVSTPYFMAKGTYMPQAKANQQILDTRMAGIAQGNLTNGGFVSQPLMVTPQQGAGDKVANWLGEGNRAAKVGVGIAAGFMGALEASKGNIWGGAAIFFAGALGSAIHPVIGLISAGIVSAIVEGIDKGRAMEENAPYQGFKAPTTQEKKDMGVPLTAEEKQTEKILSLVGNTPAIRQLFMGAQSGTPYPTAMLKEIRREEMATSIRGTPLSFIPGVSGGAKIAETALRFGAFSSAEGGGGPKINFGPLQPLINNMAKSISEREQPRYKEMAKEFMDLQTITGRKIPGLAENAPQLAPYLKPFTEFLEKQQKKYTAPVAITAIQQSNEEYLKNELYYKGSISAKTYREKMSGVEAYGASIPQYVAPLQGNYSALGDNVKTLNDAYKYISDILLKGTAEQVTELSDAKGTWELWAAKVDEMKSAGLKETDIGGEKFSFEKVSQNAAKAQTDFIQTVTTLQKASVIASTPSPTIVQTRVGKEMYPELLRGMQEMKDKQLAQLSGDDLVAYTNELQNQKFYVEFADGTMKQIEGFTQGMMQTTIDESAKIQAAVKPTTMGFQYSEYKPAQWDKAQSGYAAELLKLQQEQEKAQKLYPDIPIEPLKQTATIVELADGQTRVFVGVWDVMAHLLEENNDLTRKQLEGVFNLPEGASFWLPSQAWQYREDTTPTTGNDEALDANTAATNANTAALQQTTSPTPGGYSPMDPRSPYYDGGLMPEPPKGGPWQSKFYEDQWKEPQWTNEDLRKFSDMGPAIGPELPAGGTMPPVWGPGTTGGMFESINAILAGFFSKLFGGATGGGGGGGGGGTTGALPTVTDRTEMGTGKMPEVSTKLQLVIDNRTALHIDGRALANILETYIMEDLMRFEASTGSASTRYIT
jgi:TP901 family phage tail tape measure protein